MGFSHHLNHQPNNMSIDTFCRQLPFLALHFCCHLMALQKSLHRSHHMGAHFDHDVLLPAFGSAWGLTQGAPWGLAGQPHLLGPRQHWTQCCPETTMRNTGADTTWSWSGPMDGNNGNLDDWMKKELNWTHATLTPKNICNQSIAQVPSGKC
jgi:hypothetical protein